MKRRWDQPKNINTLGDLLRSYRCKQRLSQASVAGGTGMSQSAYSKYENDRHMPNITETILMCRLLNIPLKRVEAVVVDG